MARFIFPEWTQTFRKWLLVLILTAPVYITVLWLYGINAQAIRIGYQPKQPVPYSHALHVGELGLDCRYCHNTVERSAHAALPPAATCMNCHKMILTKDPRLLPIRESYATGKPVKWVRVHDLPDYVYFNHSAHVTRGIGCESCHGRIDHMETVYQAKPLTMEWCLDCHRHPNRERRPESKITVMGYKGPYVKRGYPITREARIKAGINPPVNPLTSCDTCHR